MNGRIHLALAEIERVADLLTGVKTVWAKEVQTLLTETTVIRVLLESGQDSAVALTDPAPQSSVEIETMAKGLPKIKVKVYDSNPEKALALASNLYEDANARYAAKAAEDDRRG